MDQSTNAQKDMMDETRAPDPVGLCFAHLSDPHLTTLRGVHWQQLLNKRVLGYLSWLHRRRDEHRSEVLDALLRDLQQVHPEHIVVTGDLTHIGLPSEFTQARAWLERLGSAERVTVVPGNHDAYIRTPWSATFAQWEPYMVSDDRAGTAQQPVFPSLRVRNGVALIGLSSATASAPFFATGSLGLEQRQRLSGILQETGAQGLFRVVLLHHPPRVEDEKWRKRLTDGNDLCSILGRDGAELVLHGHSHRPIESAIPWGERTIPVFGIPSASAIGHKPGRRAQYYLYTVARAGDSWSLDVAVRGYRLDSDDFALQHEYHRSLPVISSTSS
ncbi:MAG TPA: metallophosphoesterase [Gammaproteobacteria bacterium]|nr:metallophosphoesterase [Gammaproteobacteria bacterium]